ncbi:MAG: c-type cytochrome [Bacteroidota bacterium]
MKQKQYLFFVLLQLGILSSCANKLYPTNGESIYSSGRNLSGKVLLDKRNSQITLFKSCSGCHGPSGSRIRNCNIQWSYLTDSSKISVPYTRELFYRFMDKDIKSDGTNAKTGVHWQMTVQDKSDLLEYLRTL